MPVHLAVGAMSAAAPWVRSQMKEWAQVVSLPLSRYHLVIVEPSADRALNADSASQGAALPWLRQKDFKTLFHAVYACMCAGPCMPLTATQQTAVEVSCAQGCCIVTG